MGNIIDDMKRSERLMTDYDITDGVLKNKVFEADEAGNNDDIVDAKELASVFLELGLTKSEADELSAYFFDSANGFILDGVLDIDKVFQHINIDGNSNISLEEMRLTKKSVKIGEEIFDVSEALRIKASEMVGKDGSLDEIKLHEWMNGKPPPSETDIKIVMYLALKAAGYDDEAEIVQNLPHIIKELRENPPMGV